MSPGDALWTLVRPLLPLVDAGSERHEEDLQAFRKEVRDGRNPDLMAWTSKTMMMIEEHLKLAKEVSSKIRGARGEDQPR